MDSPHFIALLIVALLSKSLSEITTAQLFFDSPSQMINLAPIRSNPDTSNLIFSSFSGLLQQWSNSYFPNGHSIVPGIIPRSTLLYHGANHNEAPPQGIEWLAFDPEMSYSVHVVRDGPTSLYTYSSQRPLRVIYLDGQSASVGTAGYMDSQSVLVNGTVSEEIQEIGPIEVLRGEYRRAKGLCELGASLGFEGVVRMNTGFELLWCDFQTGLDLVSMTNTTDPFYIKTFDQVNPAFQIKHSPFYSEAPWESTRTATAHYHQPGESRVKLDPTGFISFYDRLNSLSRQRSIQAIEKHKTKHRLTGISAIDAQTVINRLRLVLARKNLEGWRVHHSAPDWQGIVRNILQRYTPRLDELEFYLQEQGQTATKKAFNVRRLTYAMLMPYMDLSNFNRAHPDWLEPTIEKCMLAFTSRESKSGNLTESTQVLIGAIEGTLERICSEITSIFFQAIQLDLPFSYTDSNKDPETELFAQEKVRVWIQQVDQLRAWLGWQSKIGCHPPCSANELCMIPMWPASTVVWRRPFKTIESDDAIKTSESLAIPECLHWLESKPLALLPSKNMTLITPHQH